MSGAWGGLVDGSGEAETDDVARTNSSDLRHELMEANRNVLASAYPSDSTTLRQ